MYAVSARRSPAPGFTMIEMMVVVVIVAVMLAVGVPAMSNWSSSTKAKAAVGFYAEGMALARREALTRNSASRFVLLQNAVSKQFDWRVDLCFVQEGKVCDEAGAWSTVDAPASGDPDGAVKGFRSVLMNGDALLRTEYMEITLLPAGNDKIYFTPQGWVDTSFKDRMATMRFAPANGSDDTVRPAALVVPLAGIPNICDWRVLAPDSRACPPGSVLTP